MGRRFTTGSETSWHSGTGRRYVLVRASSLLSNMDGPGSEWSEVTRAEFGKTIVGARANGTESRVSVPSDVSRIRRRGPRSRAIGETERSVLLTLRTVDCVTSLADRVRGSSRPQVLDGALALTCHVGRVPRSRGGETRVTGGHAILGDGGRASMGIQSIS